MKHTFIILGAALLITGIAPNARAGKSVKGAELRTKASFTYGRFEVRMKSFQKSGALASFFTYNDSYPSTPWNEIDIEIMGRYDHDVQFNPITPGQVNHVAHLYTPFNPAHEFHVYAFEWTPTYVAWFVDGAEAHRQTGAHIESLTQSQKIMMNVWNPTAAGWAGVFDAKTLPAFAFYDWVSYSSYTPGSGSVGTGNNFTPQWKDEFNSFDTNRWAKATHTWDGNGCDFRTENAVFSGGQLILCLTDSLNLGYQDKTAPSMLYGWANGTSASIRFSEEVDSANAVNAANYVVPGATIQAIHLREDQQTIDMQLSGVDTSATYNCISLGTRDRFGNTSSTLVKQLLRPKFLHFPIKINVGGPSWNGFLPDQEWNPSLDYGYEDGVAASAPGASISGTTEPEVFRTERYTIVQYKVRVPNGVYRVSAMMCENYFTASGQRKFSVWAEEQALAREIDLYQTAGKGTAIIRTLDAVTVSDGVLDLRFSAVINNPLVNGIIIEQVSTTVGKKEDLVPQEFQVAQNYPNPFNPATEIRYTVGAPSGSLTESARGLTNVNLSVFDMLGREVAVLVNAAQDPGIHSATFDAKGLASGLYFYRLTAGEFTKTKKMLLTK